MFAPTPIPTPPAVHDERTFLERLIDALQGKSSVQEDSEDHDTPFYFV